MNQYLKCSACGHQTEFKPETVCSECFGPLDVHYDYQALRGKIDPAVLRDRPYNMWRYYELLPQVNGGPPDSAVGWTPLVHAKRLGAELGMPQLYLKNDAVNFPTLSFKDRVVSVALAKAVDFGFKTVGCASTGNLANSVAAQASMLGLDNVVLIPCNLESQKVQATACYNTRVIKVDGNYDDVNRLCTEISYREKIGIVNVNLRPFYSEGSKTVAFETVEQLGWVAPDQFLIPMAGGSLLSKIAKGLRELSEVGLVEPKPTRLFGAQASGCAPISTMVKTGAEAIIPVKPDTIAKSLAIGAPADGARATREILGSGGWAEDAANHEIVEGVILLAKTEGIFTETAGGVTIAVLKKLLEQGRLDPEGVTVLAITGNGLKTADVVGHMAQDLPVIEPKYSAYSALQRK